MTTCQLVRGTLTKKGSQGGWTQSRSNCLISSLTLFFSTGGESEERKRAWYMNFFFDNLNITPCVRTSTSSTEVSLWVTKSVYWCIFVFMCTACSSLSCNYWMCQSVCLDSWNSALPEPVLLHNPTAMSTEPRFKCNQCHNHKLSSQYGTCPRDGQCGKKGDCLLSCLSCSAANSARRKWKHTENNHGHPAKQLATQHPILPSQFVAALATYASTSEINDSWHVSVDEMTQTDKDIAKHLASLVWKATGYRSR